MAFKRVAVVLSLGCGLLFIGQSPSAAGTKKKPMKPEPALPAVEKVLKAEVAGEVDRRDQLADTLKQYPDSAAARWQAGFVREGNIWHSFDAPNSSGVNSDSWREYVSRREHASEAYQEQLDLADWCQKKGFVDKEQAHLTSALALAPPSQQQSLLKRLHWQQVGTQWLSPEQISEWQRINQVTDASLKRWAAKLERIADRLSAGKAVRHAALAELHTFTDRSAIPAIELVLSGRDESCAEAAVETLRRIEGPESSVALAKQAVFSEWPDVRKSASFVLRSRNFEEFVPGLISLLANPAQRVQQFFFDASGAPLLQSYVLAVETEDQFRVQVFHVINQIIEVVVQSVNRGTPELPPQRIVVGPPMRRLDDVRALADRLYVQDRIQDAADDQILVLNDRVSQVLASVSGVSGSTDPHSWWQWWSGYTDTQAVDGKRVNIVSEEQTTLQTYTPVVMRVSCFAAGTPVWTQEGLVPIEAIRIGDRVLANDIESGELAYKVVLQTTVRPPKELTTLRFTDETIVCTGGHRFWCSGTGWLKARDFSPQTLLHTVTGNTPVWSVKRGETAETYNLVVADFHTYFVGRAGILCQDLLIPRGTNNVVPGLARR